MHCKVCNTRMSPGERTCPNCGNDAGPGASFTRKKKPGVLPKRKLPKPRPPTDEVELELNEGTNEPPEAPARPRPASRATSPPKAAPRRKPAGGSAPLFEPDPDGLRILLGEQPQALEEGLSVYRDEDGDAVGSAFASPVGRIDLLATDVDGDLVVVSIMEKGQGDELVAEMLKRLGWVRKHLAEADGLRVRGIVLCDEPPEDLSYTAAAVADTVTFKTYRVALTFDDVEI